VITRRTTITLVYDRFHQLAWPKGKQDSPVEHGAALNDWMVFCGVHGGRVDPMFAPTSEVVLLEWTADLATGLHDPRDVASEALRRLSREGLIEKMGGVYRPVPNQGRHP